MRTIVVPLSAVDLAETLAAMRCWLDKYRVQSSMFDCNRVGDGSLRMELGFAAEDDAEAFAAAFCDRRSSGPASRRSRLRSKGPAGRSRSVRGSARARQHQRLELRQKPQALRIFERHPATIPRDQPFILQLMQHPVDVRRG